ncbi:PAS domain-containing protein, partial [uncultured Desulfovibrio sp.]
MPEGWNNSEQLYQNVLDALPEGVLYCDTDFIVRKINKCYASLLGGDVRTMLGKPLPDLNPLTRAALVIRHGRPEMGDLCTLPLFGDNHKFVVNRIPVRDGEGVVTGMVSHILFTDP